MSRTRRQPDRRSATKVDASDATARPTPPASMAPRHLIWRYYGAVLRVFIDEPLFRAVLVLAMLVLATGTVFYHLAEGWGWLDSLYFSVITLTTVGYGDFAPTTEVARAFTIGYVLVGVGIIALLVTAVARAPFLQMELHRFRREQGLDDDEELLGKTEDHRDKR